MIPGSYRWSQGEIKAKVRPENTVAAEGPAGAAPVFGGKLWHGTGPSQNGARRRTLGGMSATRPMFDGVVPRPTEFVTELGGE